MKLDKTSRIFTRIMLSMYLFVTLFAVGFCVFNIAEYKSYILAFIAATFVLLLIVLAFRHRDPLKFTAKLGKFKTGLILSIICFLLNFIWVFFFRLSPEVDYFTFWNTAAELAADKTISGARYIAMFPHIMGYSAFLSLFLKLFGSSVMTATVLNVVLTTISGIIIYVLCLRWSDIRSAALAFILWIICPSKLLYNAMVLSEPYYTCMLLCFLLIISYLEGKTNNEKVKPWIYALWAIPAAIALAAMNSARPIAAVPIIAFFIWLVLLRGEKLKSSTQWKKWLAFSAVFVIIYALSGNLWKTYMRDKLGEEPSSTPGYSICVGFNPESMGSYSQDDMDKLVSYTYEVYGNSNDAQKHMMEDAKARIKEGEVPVLKLFAVKLRTLLGNDEGGAYYSRKALSPTAYSVLAVGSNVYYYILIIMMVSGTVRVWKEKRSSVILIVPLYILGLSLAHMLVEVAIRYHYSMVPMFIILAAFSYHKKESGRSVNNAA